MTDAEKMREAAAKACDRIAGNTADFRHEYRRAAGQCAAMIRALPIPDAPAAGCQQAGDAGLLDEAMRLLDTYERRSEHAYLCLCRQGNQCDCGISELRSETGDLLDRMRAARLDPGLLDEVKAALRAAGDALADSQWSGGSAERRVSAALARLEREVG